MATVNAVPNALAQFFDNQGKPLANGKVYFYQPNTNPPVLATTWQDPYQNVVNPNPVQLDANGRAPIFGIGPYRQVVYDQFGDLIWDSNVSGIFTASGVASVFGRSGTVVAAQGDYSPGLIGTAAQGTELTGLSNLATTGAVQRTGAGTYSTVTLAPSATTDTTNASNITSGTLAAARGGAGTVNGILKANGAGVVSAAVSGTDYAPATNGTSGQALTSNGLGGFGTPVTLAASATTDTTNASNITSGTLPNARLSAVPNSALANSSVTISGHVLALGGTLSLVASDVGLGNVTNDTQTKAAIVPNTLPTAGQVLVGNAGGTAYAPVSVSGDGTLSSAGALTVTKTNGVSFAPSATTDTTNANNITSGTLAAARGGAGTVSGILKANGAGVVSAAVSGTDYAPPTNGKILQALTSNGSGGFGTPVTLGSLASQNYATQLTRFETPGGPYTYNVPSGAKLIHAILYGGGGGGGSGCVLGASTACSGGGGGGGGGRAETFWDASTLPSTLSVTVGAGGTGGAATTSSTGNNGAAGGLSQITGAGIEAITAYGGGAGSGGAQATASGGGGGGSIRAPGGNASGATGGSATYPAIAGGSGTSASGNNGPSGGSGGGGCSSTGAPGAGGVSVAGAYGGGNGGGAGAGLTATGGTSAGGSGGRVYPDIAYGATPVSIYYVGSAGFGGASSTSANGGNGQDGVRGSGGGGGGSTTTGFTAGAGGNGGNGAVYIIAHL